MSIASEILQSTAHLPDQEKAAALAHAVYIQTAHAMGSDWSLRVPDAWENLDDAARAFNLASVEMWAEMPEVLEAWVAAIKGSRKQT